MTHVYQTSCVMTSAYVSDVLLNGGAPATIRSVDELLANLLLINADYSLSCLLWVNYSDGYMLKVRLVFCCKQTDGKLCEFLTGKCSRSHC